MTTISLHPRSKISARIDSHNGSEWITVRIDGVEIVIHGTQEPDGLTDSLHRLSIMEIANALAAPLDMLWAEAQAATHDADESNVLQMADADDRIPF